MLSGAEVESKNKEKTIQVTADKEETILSLDEKTTLELTDDPDEFIIEDVDWYLEGQRAILSVTLTLNYSDWLHFSAAWIG